MMHLNQSADANTGQSALLFQLESFAFVFDHVYVRLACFQSFSRHLKQVVLLQFKLCDIGGN